MIKTYHKHSIGKLNMRSISRMFFANFKKRKILIFSLIALLIILPISLIIFNNKSTVEAAWWNDTWAYRQTVAITNAGTAQTDFQAAITLNTSALITAGKMQSDCDDIRITDVSGKALAHWIQTGTNACNSATTKIWTKVPSISITGTTVFLYYGNPSATNTENGKSTFIYFEDFTSIAGWTAYGTGGTISQPSAGLIQMNNPSASCRIWTTPATDIPSITNGVLEMRYALANAAGAEGGPLTKVGSDPTNGAIDGYQIALRGRGSNDMPVWRMDNMSTGCGGLTNINSNYGAGWSVPITFQVGKIIMNGSTQTWYPDIDSHAVTSTSWTDAAYSSGSIGFWEYSTSDLQGDWIFARKFSSTEPSIATPTNEQKSPAPVAYWKFDEGYGTTTKNSSQYNYPGTLGSTAGTDATAPIWATEDQCISGKCLKFNGTTDTVDFDDYDNLSALKFDTGNWSVSVWIRAPSSSSKRVVFGLRTGSDQDFHIGIDTSNRAYIEWVSYPSKPAYTTTTSSSTIADNKWHQIAAKREGGTITLYVDGISVGTDSTVASYDITGPGWFSRWTAGSWFNGCCTTFDAGVWQNFFKGYMDDVKIYPYARTAAQIKSDFASKGSGSIKGTSVQMGSNTKNSDAFSNGLVGYWKMDEAATPSVDSSGNGNNGTWANSPAAIAGVFGNGIDIPGVGGSGIGPVVNVADSDSIDIGYTNSMTSAFWIKNDSGVCAAIIKKTSMWEIYRCSSSLVVRFDGASPTDYSSATALTNGQWYHVIVTRNYQTGKTILYLNGQKDTEWTFPVGAPTTNGGLGIGAYNGGAWAIDGKLDDVRLYNRELSPKEVRDLYNWAPGPVGYWNMDEGTGINANDLSGNGITGTLQSSPTWSTGKFGKGLNFNGTSQYITTSSNPLTYFTASKGYTVESWVKLDQYQPNPGCCGSRIAYTNSGDGGFDWRIWNNGVVNFYRPTTWCAAGSSVTVPLNQWTHLAATYNNQQVYVYMNGIQVASTNSCNFLDSTAGIVFNYPGGSHGLYGSMDDSKVYNYARSPKQIVEDMNAGHPIGGSPVGSQVGYWKFDEGYSTVANDSGPNILALSLVNSASWTNAGKFGKALSLNGASQRQGAQRANNAALNPGIGSFTTSAWIKTSQTGAVKRIVTKRGSSSTWYSMYINNNKLTFETAVSYPTYYSSSSGPTTINDGNWHYVAMIRDTAQSKVLLYVDGKQDLSSTDNTAGQSMTNAEIFEVGIWGTETYDSGSYTGQIDEVKFYNSALTPDEIKLDYNRGSAMVLGEGTEQGQITDGLILNLDSTNTSSYPGSGTTWFDISGSSNDFTIEGAPQFDAGQGFGDFGSGKRIYRNNFPQNLKTSQGGQGYTVLIWAKSTGGQGGWRKPLGNNDGENYIDLYQNASSPYAYTTEAGETLFVDGVQYANNTYVVPNSGWHLWGATNLNGGGTSNPVGALTIGNEPNGTSYPWIGKIAIVRLYNRVLAPGDMKQIYDLEAGKFGLTNTGPVGEWKMDEKTGVSANDTSGNGNTGTLTLGPTWTNGKVGAGVNFDGGDDSVNVNSSASLNLTNATIEGWFYPTIRSGGVAMSTGGGWLDERLVLHFGYPADNKIKFTISNGTNYRTLTSISNLNLNQWSHITVTVDGTNMKIFINGILDNSQSQLYIPNTNGVPLYIGKTQGLAPDNFAGKIDQVRIYNYARTPAQIAYDYNRGGPIGWWKIDECQGITANDSSGNNNMGTITIGASGSQTAVGTCTTSGTAWYNGRTGKYNSSLNFDGTDDTVLVPYSSSLNPTNSISITAWVKPNVVTAYKEVLRQEEANRKLLSFQPEGATGTALAFGLNVGGSYTELDAPITASEWTNGSWHFITATFNGSVKKVYDNGKEIGSENISGALGAGTQPIYIGSTSGGGEFFSGQIDDVRIYNYALTPVQIKTLYNGGAAIQFAPATGSP